MELPSRFCSDFIITALLGNRRCATPLDHCKYTDEQITADCNLCELKGDGTAVTHDPCANFDQPDLHPCQRTICDRLWKIRALQEHTKIAGHCVKLKSGFVLDHAVARQSCPVVTTLLTTLKFSQTSLSLSNSGCPLHDQILMILFRYRLDHSGRSLFPKCVSMPSLPTPEPADQYQLRQALKNHILDTALFSVSLLSHKPTFGVKVHLDY